MAQNRVQYQKGLSMPEFFDRFGSVQQCEERFRVWRWPSGFVCPRCEQTWHSKFWRHDRLCFQCGSCRYQCSLVSGTIFESSNLPLPRWFLAMHLMTQAKNNVSALELKRHLGVSYPTAWLLKHKIMQVMVLREAQRQLTGRVEIDDAYLVRPSQRQRPRRRLLSGRSPIVRVAGLSPNRPRFLANCTEVADGSEVPTERR
jgi:transposase-like protein